MGVHAANLDSPDSPLTRAIEIAGGRDKLALAVGVSGPFVSQWKGGVRSLNPEYCPAIEQATGVKCDELRPDLLWVRDGSGEVLAYAIPVDGADVAYVRQALDGADTDASATELRADTVVHADAIKVGGTADGLVSIKIDAGIGVIKIEIDALESARVAAAILAERERVMPLIPAGLHEELAQIPHALLPMRVHLEETGLHMDVSVVDESDTVKVVRSRSGDRCVLMVGGTERVLDRAEADAIAYGLTGGNDGSAIAHHSSLACDAIGQAIKLLRTEQGAAIGGEVIANLLAVRQNSLLDLYYAWRQHTIRRFGSERQGQPPAEHVADRLADAAHLSIDTMARLRAILQRDGSLDRSGYPVEQRGIFRELGDAITGLRQALSDMHLRGESQAEKVVWQNPLEAFAMKQDAFSEAYTTNLKWRPAPESTVSDCLEEATLTLGAALKIIFGNMYDESEDSMSILLGMAKASVSCAHSKLLQFAQQERGA